MNRIASSLLVSAALLVTTGCDNTRDGLEKDAEENSRAARREGRELKEDVKRGAEKAKETTADAADDVKRGAEQAAEATAEAVDEAGARAIAAGRTLAVKTALMADTRVNASHVDVDSDFVAKIVHLRGTVPTAAEKTIAGEIARDKADGWQVSNELVVGTAPAP